LPWRSRPSINYGAGVKGLSTVKEFFIMSSSPIILVLDANIWIRERMLRSSLGAALLYAVRKLRAKIALSEVTKAETVKGIVKAGTDSVQKIQNAFVTIQTITGSRPDYNLPTSEELERSADERLNELSDILYPVQLSYENMKSALTRVLNESSPSAKKEQFRDSLLWETVLGLAETFEVHLITEDSDFYQDGGPGKGLAQDLIREIKEKHLQITTYKDIGTFLKSVSEKILPPEPDKLASAIDEGLHATLIGYADDKAFHLESMVSHEIDSYLTEQKDVLAIAFELNYRITDIQLPEGTVLPTGSLVVTGYCSADSTSEEISGMQLGNIDCFGPNGEAIPIKSTGYARLDAVMGVRKVPYRLRRKLTEALSPSKV
jgi:hypothetical protein